MLVRSPGEIRLRGVTEYRFQINIVGVDRIGHALGKVTALCAKGIGESNANDGIGAPITVPVTASVITSVTSVPGGPRQYTILQLQRARARTCRV